MRREQLRRESHEILDMILDIDSNKEIMKGNKWAKKELKKIHGQ